MATEGDPKGDTEPPARYTHGNRRHPDKDEEEGWQTVTRRKRRLQQPQRRIPPTHTGVKQRRYTTFNRNKCFRCLSQYHQVAQCREPIRCHKCLKLGHYSYRCTIKPQPTPHKTKPISQPKHSKPKTYAQAVNPNMAFHDDHLEPFWDERPEEDNVFLPSLQPLRPAVQFLERAAWVEQQIGVPSPAFIEAVRRTLARVHGGPLSTYRCETTGRNKCLLIFHSEQLKDAAVQEGPYVIPALGAQFYLRAWLPTDGMHHRPSRYESWIRLIGVPLHMWHTEGIHRLATRLGTVRTIMPYGLPARQLQHITVQLATGHPRTIPKFLRAKMGEYEKIIQVKLLAWRLDQPTDFPPPPDMTQGRQQIPRQPLQPHHHAQPPRHHPPPSPNIHPYSGESSAESNDHPWAASRPVATQVNLAHRKPKGIWVPKPKGIPVTNSLALATTANVIKRKLTTGNPMAFKLLSREERRIEEQIARLVQIMKLPGEQAHISTPTTIILPEKKREQSKATPKTTTMLGSIVTVYTGSAVAAKISLTYLTPGIKWLMSHSTLSNITVSLGTNVKMQVQKVRRSSESFNEEPMDGTGNPAQWPNSWLSKAPERQQEEQFRKTNDTITFVYQLMQRKESLTQAITLVYLTILYLFRHDL
ncbi:hypothetical protein FCM35_KLT00497 [Carex littledalei]|uniref:CCHC-type domain-containing protein n=1 Tax=Carex littledalei TaxID=544730 RepID=A0A833RIK2_9POAL|nr:hypothetical protein FCM35_KLT00497 [Carex littledalei]